ncbi:T4 family baseplate hub assembly chaperone [Pseudochelatococcus sp. B33]
MNAPIREAEFVLPIGFEGTDGVVRRRGAVRKMTGREEAILAEKSNQGNGGKLVTELIHSCVTQFEGSQSLTKQDVANWYSADRNYVLIRLRAFTFGPELPATYTCTSCGEKLEVVENLDELPVKVLGENEELAEVVVELQDGYWDKDQCHTSMSLTLPKGIDETVVAPLIRKNPSNGKNALLARCLTRLGDMPKHRLEQLGSRIFQELTLTDRRLIDRALNQAAPGIDLSRDCICPSCGSNIRTSLDMTHFLSPD